MVKNKIHKSLSQGCKFCYHGAKLVLFITGRCDRNCWYCPLSKERKNVDIIFANDVKVTNISDVITEATVMNALGTGVTGGEPLLELDRVIEYCTHLKDHFGKSHHIHLYTGHAPTESELSELSTCVDEIRMHPPYELWSTIMTSNYFKSISIAKKMGFSVGIEVPSLPGLHYFFPILDYLDFFNINQLEWGDTCSDEMRFRGLELESPFSNAIRGSTKWACEINGHPKIHYCTSTFKDTVQLRERLKRIAMNTARPFDIITDDGTIMYGSIDPLNDLDLILGNLRSDQYELMPDGTMELGYMYLKRIPDKYGSNRKIIERYPNNGMIVEVIPQ